jgi:hypothetical protein
MTFDPLIFRRSVADSAQQLPSTQVSLMSANPSNFSVFHFSCYKPHKQIIEAAQIHM